MVTSENPIRRFLREEIASNPDPTFRAVTACRVSRKTVQKHLAAMRKDGSILCLGTPRKRRYRLPPTADLVERVSTDPANLPKLLSRCEGILQGLSPGTLARATFGIEELLANARKHAGASHVQFMLLRLDPLVEISVTDSGPGLFAHLNADGAFGDDREAAVQLGEKGHGVGLCLQVFDRAFWWSGTGVFGRGRSGGTTFTTHARGRNGTTARLVLDSRVSLELAGEPQAA